MESPEMAVNSPIFLFYNFLEIKLQRNQNSIKRQPLGLLGALGGSWGVWPAKWATRAGGWCPDFAWFRIYICFSGENPGSKFFPEEKLVCPDPDIFQSRIQTTNLQITGQGQISCLNEYFGLNFHNLYRHNRLIQAHKKKWVVIAWRKKTSFVDCWTTRYIPRQDSNH